MDKRTWIKSRRKKRVRLLAAAMCVSLLVTANSGTSAAVSVLAAAEELETGESLCIYGFEELSEEIREQYVPVGTALSELTLPDALEAAVQKKSAANPPEDGEEKDETPSEDEGKKDETPSEDEGEKGEVPPENEGDKDETPAEDEGEKDQTPPENGEGEDQTPSENEGETDETSSGDAGETGEPSSDAAEESGDAEGTKEEIAEVHEVFMQENYVPRVLAVKTLSAETETVFIEGVTWDSVPAYDAEQAETYLFTAVLPEGYALADGVSLPEIVVTVQEDAEKKPATAAGRILKEILENYFDGVADDGIYDVICAMDEETCLLFIADYEELLAALTGEDDDDRRLLFILGEMERGIAAALDLEAIEPVFFRVRAAASEASEGIELCRVSGEGEGFIYHHFREPSSFATGETYAFLNGIYAYEDAVASLGSGAVLKILDEENGSKHYIQRKYGTSADVKNYVKVITPGRDFDKCPKGGLYQVPDSGKPAEYRYFCYLGGAQNCGPYYAYAYEKQSLTYENISASLNDMEKQGSADEGDYTVWIAYGDGRTVILDTESYKVQIPDPASDEVIITVSDSEGNVITANFTSVIAVSYEGNAEGVSNLPPIQIVERNTTCNLSAMVPLRTGYSFVNWKDAKSDKTYAPGEAVKFSKPESLWLQAQWKDTQKPDAVYMPVQVMTRTPDEDVEAAVREALVITDNEPVEECTVTITVPPNIAATVGNKNVTVTVTDKAGNTRTAAYTVEVISYVDIGTPAFVADTRKLSAVLKNPGTDKITESGFVWGIMNAPTLTVNNGKQKTASPVSTLDGTISVTADNLQKGVTYYARAYIVAENVAYYSDEIEIGIGLPAYGTFTIKNNGNNTFTVTREGGAEGSQTVYYRTVNGSAVGGTHFTHQAKTLTFAAGETTQTITVSEQGVSQAYVGKPATAYTNADRVYSVELYRVTGGGALGDTVSAERKMKKNDSYVVEREIYDEQTINGLPDADEEGTIRGYTRNDSLYGWDKNGVYVNAQESVSIKDNLCPGSREYWTNTAQKLHYRLAFGAYKSSIASKNDGYPIIQITPGTDLDTDVYPDLTSMAIRGTPKAAHYVACFPCEKGINKLQFYTFPYTDADLETGVANGTYSEGEEAYVVFKKTQENIAVGYGSGLKNNPKMQDRWYTKNVMHHFWIKDTEEPQLLGVAPMAGGLYKKGDPFTVSLIFDEIVDGQNSGDLTGITVNTTWGPAQYAGGADTNVLYFTGKVSSADDSGLQVTGFTNADRIKDMCEGDSTKVTASGAGSTTATVDTAQPQFTVAAKGISNGTGKALVTVRDDKTKTSGLRYAWSDSASMPVSGWVEASSAELASAKGTGLELSIRKEPGSGSSSGKWYLHVIGVYDTTGATDYRSAYVDFGTASKPAAGSTKPVLEVSTDNAWAKERTITVQASGAETLAYRKSGESAWKTLAAGAKSVTVTENGYYTFKLTAGDDTITRSIQAEKIDRVEPTASIGEPLESGTDKTAKGEIYTKITLPVTYADGQSGVKKVEYAWTGSSDKPAEGAWKQLAAGTSQITYTAAENARTPKYLHLRVTDQAGNVCCGKSAAYTVISKSMTERAPGITLTGAPTQWTNDMATLEWALQDYEGKNYEVILADGRTAKAGASSGEIWAPRNGTYTVKVRDTEYGTENTASLEVTKIDRTPPTVTAPAFSDDWKGSGQTITLSVSDGESGVGKKYSKIVSTDEEKPTEGLEELAADSVTVDQEGVWYVYYKVYDNTGDDTVGREANKTEGFIGPVKIDLQTPGLTVAGGNTGVPESQGLSLSLKAAYGISGGTVKAGEKEISELAVSPEDTEFEKETAYLVKEQGNYQFTIQSGSGKKETVSCNVYEAAFETGMDTETETQLVAEDGKLTEPALPENTGYTWEGWYTAETDGSLWNFETDTVSENMTLYARWADQTPPDAPALQEGFTLQTVWNNTQKTIPLTLYDSVCVTELWVSIDDGAYQQVTDFSNSAQTPKTDYSYTGVLEGGHTYRFQAKDAAGNASAESTAFQVMLDENAPQIGELVYENKAANLWQWIIGKTSLIIHVPVTEEGSGVEKISYTMTPVDADGTADSGKTVTKTASVKDNEAKIAFAKEFRGTITITCKDRAGNAADSVTVGTSEAGGVIVEDKAPVVSVLADRGVSDISVTQPGGIALSDSFYETVPALTVTVKDDMDHAITAGIDTVAYQVGEAGVQKSVNVDKSDLQAAAQATFTIPASEIPTGVTVIRIHATDNAGNETTERIIVKVKGPEKTPEASIDYKKEGLVGLTPEKEYKISVDGGERTVTADENGEIPIDPAWFGKEISIVKAGDGKNTTDSDEKKITIPVRPAKPVPSATSESAPGRKDGKLTGLEADKKYQVSTDGGKTWTEKTADAAGEVTDLAPGSYVVRVSPTDTDFAGETSAAVTIAEKKVTVIFMADGSQYATREVSYGKDLTDIPSVPEKTGDQIYTGEWCMDEQGKVPAVFMDIRADMTVYAVYTKSYTVTLQGGTGYALSAESGSVSPVKEGGSFTFRFTLSNGYVKAGGFAVKVNGTAVELSGDGAYTISGIVENKTVTVEGVKKKSSGSSTGGGDKKPGSGDSGDNGGADDQGGGKPGAAEGKPGTGDGKPGSGGNAQGNNGGADGKDGRKPGSAEGKPGTGDGKPGSGGNAQGNNGGADDQGGGKPGTAEDKRGDGTKPEDAGKSEKTESMQQAEKPESGSIRTVPATVENGRIVVTGDPFGAGNVNAVTRDAEEEPVIVLQVDGGAVVVSVICEDEQYTAGVRDTAAVANAVLTTEQIEQVKGGETIEIRIDVTDISGKVPRQDQEVIDKGLDEQRKNIPGLVLGSYVDISMYIMVGGSGWNAVTGTDRPVEVVIGIPEELREDGRKYYIIRSHEGEFTFMDDLDDLADTITVSTDKFSCYAIAYVPSADGGEAGGKCGLCHICPTFLGICYFLWGVIILAAAAGAAVIVKRKKEDS